MRSRLNAYTAVAASSLALLGVAAMDSGALAAGPLHSCGSHTFTVQISSGTTPPTYTPFKEQAKNIKAGGLSCSAALKWLGKQLNNKTSKTIENYKCTTAPGKYKEPVGFFPEVCTKGSKKIVWGQQGG